MIGLVFITDGREYLWQSLASAQRHLPEFDVAIIVDDSGTQAAAAAYGTFTHVVAHETRRGLSAAVQSAWTTVLSTDCDYVFHLEDDFTFPVRPPLERMRSTLDANPHLAQMALYRSPYSPEEHIAGGYLNLHADDYEQHDEREAWLETAQGFTLNPSLLPRWVTEHGWPTHGSEGDFTESLLIDHPKARFGLWGFLHDSPRTIHIGQHRSPGWIL